MIGLFKFGGAIPRLAPYLLSEYQAQVADGCDTSRGDLRSIRAPKKVANLSLTSVQTIYQWYDGTNTHWIESDKDLDFVRSPIANDKYKRLFFTGESEPRYFANDNIGSPFDPSTDYIKLGVPAPTAAPTIGSTGGSEYRAYLYCYVTRYGDPGSNSPVASLSTHKSGNRVTISNIQSAPAKRAIDRIWLYRTNSDSAGNAEFQYVLEAKFFDSSESYAVGDYVVYSNQLYECTTAHSGAWNASNFTEGEAVSDDDLGESFAFELYIPPPDNLKGLIGLPSGVFAGFVGNTLYLSEPYKPHAWPHSKSFHEQIVGLAVLGSSIVVATDGYPKLIYGQDPAAMAKVDIPLFAPCRAKRSMVSGRGAVYFRSDEGLARISESGGQIVTDSIITKDDWKKYKPIHGQYHEGKYFGWHVSGGIIIDFDEGTFVTVPLVVHTGYVSVIDENYYIVQDDTKGYDPNNPPANIPLCISAWATDNQNYIQYTWRSKLFLIPSEINFAYARLIMDRAFYDKVLETIDLLKQNQAIFSGDIAGALRDNTLRGITLRGDKLLRIGDYDINTNVTLKLIESGEVKASITVTSSDSVFALPGGFTGKQYEFEITGYVPVYGVMLGTSLEDLQQWQ